MRGQRLGGPVAAGHPAGLSHRADASQDRPQHQQRRDSDDDRRDPGHPAQVRLGARSAPSCCTTASRLPQSTFGGSCHVPRTVAVWPGSSDSTCRKVTSWFPPTLARTVPATAGFKITLPVLVMGRVKPIAPFSSVVLSRPVVSSARAVPETLR